MIEDHSRIVRCAVGALLLVEAIVLAAVGLYIGVAGAFFGILVVSATNKGGAQNVLFYTVVAMPYVVAAASAIGGVLLLVGKQRADVSRPVSTQLNG